LSIVSPLSKVKLSLRQRKREGREEVSSPNPNSSPK